ncbi:MAG: immunity 17 family protein [Anaerolineales bacterium]
MNVIIFLLGIFSIACGLLKWDWFMDDYKARIFVKLLGRDGARIFYILLGVALAILAVWKSLPNF